MGRLFILAGFVQSLDFATIRKASQYFFLPNPGYCSSWQSADLALIKLEQGFEFDQYVSPIHLTNLEICDGSHLTITGWGGPEGSPPFDILQKGNITVDIDTCGDWEDCAQPSLVCARLTENGQAADRQDSGGLAVFYDAEGKAHQIGVISHSIYPALYFNTKIFLFREWIKGITGLGDLEIDPLCLMPPNYS